MYAEPRDGARLITLCVDMSMACRTGDHERSSFFLPFFLLRIGVADGMPIAPV